MTTISTGRRVAFGRIVKGGAAASMALALTFGLFTTAQADEPDTATAAASAGYTKQFRITPGYRDNGGVDGEAYLHRTSDNKSVYEAWFRARNETLELKDKQTDGRKAKAEVRVYGVRGNTSRPIDKDTFRTGGTAKYNLGTPDGSGNIPENYQIRFRVCIDGTSTCSAWVNVRS